MPFTNEAAQFMAFRMGSAVPSFIGAVEIGIGSGTALVTNSDLVTGSVRNIITGSPDFSEARKTGFQADFNSVEMSGVALTEFGLYISGPVNVGSVWFREAFGSVTFDGTNELQVTVTGEVIPG